MQSEQSNKQQTKKLAFLPFQQKGWRGWMLKDWHDFQPFLELDRWLENPDGHVVLDTLCRKIVKHGTPRGILYSKLMRAQNDGVIKKRELFSKFKWKFYPSRAICILRTTGAMLELGHNCPIPILGIRRKKFWGMPQDLYVATEIPDPTVEERILQAKTSEERRDVLAICGTQLARFHGDGFVHGDFLPRNTCLSPDNQIFSYLDNDRTRRWPNTPIFHFKRRNLTQFCFNLFVLGFHEDPRLQQAFLEAYAREAGWSQLRLTQETKTINGQNERRWAKAISDRRRKQSTSK